MEAKGIAKVGCLTIGKKIGFGFFFVLLLLGGIVGVSYKALNTASADFSRYRDIARKTNALGRIQANLLDARIAAKNYIVKSNRDNLTEFDTRWQTMKQITDETIPQIDREELKSEMKNIEENVIEYKTHFYTVKDYIAQRDEHFAVLNNLGPEIERSLTSIMDSAKKDDDIESALSAGYALRNLLLARLYVMKFMTDNNPQDAQRAFAEFSAMDEQIEALIQKIDSPQRRALLQKLEENKKLYCQSFSKVEKSIVARNAIITEHLDTLGPKVAEAVEHIKLGYKQEQDALGPKVQKDNRKATMLIVILGLSAIAIGITLAWVITYMIVSAMNAVVSVMKTASTGDLRQRVTVKCKDEIGQMANTFNSLLDSWNKIIRNIIEVSKILTDNADSISTTSQHMLEGSSNLASSAQETSISIDQMAKGSKEVLSAVEGQASSVAQTTAAVEEMSRNIQVVFKNVESQTSAVNQSTSAVEELLASVKQIAENSNKVRSFSQTVTLKASEGNEAAIQTAKGMQDIADSSQQINNIIAMITGIAAQTNLLALNAAIEAARAGDAGKGFAVVADEVRDLAEQSQQAAKEITELIQAANGKAERGVQLVEGVNNAIKEISSAAQAVDMLANEVGNATTEQETGVQEIATAMESLNELTQNVFHAMEEQSQGAGEISQVMQTLSTSSEQVRGSIDEQVSAISQIAKAINMVSEVSEENEQSAGQSSTIAVCLKEQSDSLRALISGLTI